MPFRFIGDFDPAQLEFQPFASDGGRSRVIIEDPTCNRKQFEYQLCKTVQTPIQAKYGLDRVQEDGNPDRRGLTLKITDEKVIETLKKLDDTIIDEAMKRSKEWFKGKELTREAVLARYKPLLTEYEDHHAIKIKVKVGQSKVKTSMHLQDGDYIRKHGATELDLTSGAKVVPVVSAYALWFMAGGATFGLSLQAEQLIVTPQTAKDELDDFISDVPLKRHKEEEVDDTPVFLQEAEEQMGQSSEIQVELE